MILVICKINNETVFAITFFHYAYTLVATNNVIQSVQLVVRDATGVFFRRDNYTFSHGVSRVQEVTVKIDRIYDRNCIKKRLHVNMKNKENAK